MKYWIQWVMKWAVAMSVVYVLTQGSALAEAPDAAVQPITALLALGPLPIDVALWSESGQQAALITALQDQLERGPLAGVGRTLRVFGESLTWTEQAPEVSAAGLSVWAIHLDTDRFTRGRLSIEGLHEPVVLFNGSVHRPGDQGVALDLSQGTHVLWLVHAGATAHDHEDDGDEPPAVAISWQGRQAHDRLRSHVEPQRRVSAQLLTNAPTVTAMALSADGRQLAMTRQGRLEAADQALRETVIIDLERGVQRDSWTGSVPRGLYWSPDQRWLAIHADDGLWLRELATGRMRLVLANPSRAVGWRWHPSSGSLLFTWTRPDDSDQAVRRRFRSLEDRWAGFRDNSQLFELDINSGLVRPLTALPSSVRLHDIHPDGDRVLLSQRVIDYAEPPHSLFTLMELELDTLVQREITALRQFNDVVFADQGYWLLSGPGLHLNGESADGATTQAPLVANEYDTQLYRLSQDGTQARSVSRQLDPALAGVQRLVNGDLLLTATAADRSIVLHFDAAREAFNELDFGFELVEDAVVSQQLPLRLVARGTSVTTPQRVHQVDFDRRGRPSAPTVVWDSASVGYADVVFGTVHDWSFTNDAGDVIDGRYYLPPDFDDNIDANSDAKRRYPLIVYYYGGTTPVSRGFTGRYPFNLWAAKGYVVYVLQPRGTIGYGQRFSALHVNAWGRYTADDIMAGTDAFVAAHDFVDGDRVGNIGASYGGFMTMHLATLTDRYAAAVSHAGISALTNYWGQGWWGYGYSGIASRGSFPWNNPELYVGQSPIYSADRITTPLLLVTGDSDTNVPPGESHNMFTALKLLGREVELVEFPGEDHWILDRQQRYVWWDTMLAWFDRWLKDEPEWWQHLYADE